MRKILVIICVFLLLPLSAIVEGQEDLEENVDNVQMAQAETTEAAEGAEEGEEFYEGEEPAPAPVPFIPPEGLGEPPELPGEAELEPEELPEEEGEEPLVEDVFDEIIPEEAPPPLTPKKITIDMVVTVDYQFYESPDAFKIKYHINMGGNANLAASIIRGQAEVATEVTGFLAKWPEGQCVLNVSIAKVPYEINYSQTAEDEADLNINFKKEITEIWESNCTFLESTAKPFKTEGPPEKWISEALKKASPPLSAIIAPVESGEPTTTTFDIPEYTVIEEDLGSATVKGTGVVNLQPLTSPGATPIGPGVPAGPTGRLQPRRPGELPIPLRPGRQFRAPNPRKTSRTMVRRRALP